MKEVEVISKYFGTFYGESNILDFTDKNYTFDYLCVGKNIHIKIESKVRHEIYDDILIEVVQDYPYLNKGTVTNSNINTSFDAYSLLIALGWFAKTSSDRFIFIRCEGNKLYDIIDIDYPLFKNWFMDSIGKKRRYNLQYSDLSTGTINIKVPIKDIPKAYYKTSIMKKKFYLDKTSV